MLLPILRAFLIAILALHSACTLASGELKKERAASFASLRVTVATGIFRDVRTAGVTALTMDNVREYTSYHLTLEGDTLTYRVADTQINGAVKVQDAYLDTPGPRGPAVGLTITETSLGANKARWELVLVSRNAIEGSFSELRLEGVPGDPPPVM